MELLGVDGFCFYYPSHFLCLKIDFFWWGKNGQAICPVPSKAWYGNYVINMSINLKHPRLVMYLLRFCESIYFLHSFIFIICLVYLSGHTKMRQAITWNNTVTSLGLFFSLTKLDLSAEASLWSILHKLKFAVFNTPF